MFYLVFFSSSVTAGNQIVPNLLKILFIIIIIRAKFNVTCKTLYLTIIAIYMSNAIF